MKNESSKAFSLIELLIGLIIISIATAAFAPIATKRAKAQKTALEGKLTEKNCAAYFGSKCTLCYGNKSCAICTLNCNLDQQLDFKNCKCINP